MQLKNIAVVSVTALITALVLLVGWVAVMGTGRGMMGGFGMGFPMFGGLMLMPMLLLPVLLVAGLVGLVVALTRGTSAAQSSPLDVLKQRYAHGELSQEQFEAMRKTLDV